MKMNLDETSHEYNDNEPQDKEEYEEEEPQVNEKLKNISMKEGINESYSQKDSKNLFIKLMKMHLIKIFQIKITLVV